MKQLIVLIASIPIMVLFIMQIVLTSANFSKAQAVRRYVEEAEAIAKQVGYFSAENKADLKRKIATKLDVDESEITISATSQSNMKYRTNTYDKSDLMHIKVVVVLPKTVVGGSFFGVGKDSGKIQVEDWVASEKLP